MLLNKIKLATTIDAFSIHFQLRSHGVRRKLSLCVVIKVHIKATACFLWDYSVNTIEHLCSAYK